jgi:hypothetical protein
MKSVDLTGKRFGKLTVLKKLRKAENGSFKWLCKCECGNTTMTYTGNLNTGHTKTCGDRKVHFSTHSMSRSRPYRIWGAMMSRCHRESSTNYHNYGGKGIAVCEDWKTFRGFWDDMKNGYSDNLTIDRLDNEKGYFKGNCKWSTREEQDNNTRRTRRITFEDKTQSLTQWANELKINPKTLDYRFRNGWTVKRALTTPVNKKYRRKTERINEL